MCGNYHGNRGTCSSTHYLRADAIEQVVMLELRRLSKCLCDDEESFAALLGHEIPNPRWDRSAPIGFNDTIAQGEYLTGGLGRHIYKLIACIRNVLDGSGEERAGKQCDVLYEPSLAGRGENVRCFGGSPGAGAYPCHQSGKRRFSEAFGKLSE